MKLMIDASLQSTGGGVQVAVNLINNLIDDNFYSDILFIVSPQVDAQIHQETKDRFAFCVLKNAKGPLKFIQGKKISRFEERFKPDLVFIVFGPSYWKPKAKSLQGFAVPHLAYPDMLKIIYKYNFKKKILTNCVIALKKFQITNNTDFMVVETETFKALISDKTGLDKEKIYVIQNSFNKKFTNFEATKIDNSSGSLVNIFIPSAYYPHKNLDILVDVAKILHVNYKLNFKFNFLIDDNSDNWLNIYARAQNQGVESSFSTYGQVDNNLMSELYSVNNLILLPTLLEVSSAVYPESFISKKPLLTSNLEFAAELCGDAASYFDPLDPEDIASKINECAKNKEMQETLISNGVKQLKNQYITPDEKYLKQRRLLINLYENDRV